MEVGIVILPSEFVSARAIELSKEIWKNEPSEFVLNEINFIPHITLSRLKNRENSTSEKMIEGLPSYEMSFDVNQIGIVQIGEHGSCKRVLKVVGK